MKDGERRGRSSTSTTLKQADSIRELSYKDGHKTIRDIASDNRRCLIQNGVVNTKISLNTDLIAATYVLRILSIEEKAYRVQLC